MNDVGTHMALLCRGAVDVISEPELRTKLSSGRRLRVKAGFDPTSADLHLGHTVIMRKLRHFQLLGHEVIFLIGDFTARIGDPSGRSETRPVLDAHQISRNAATYEQQAFRILERSQTQVVWNSSWMEKLAAADIIRLAAEFTVARMLERDDFQERFRRHQPIGLHEFLYPLMQGYDSVEVDADVEIGGTDQKFNLLVGRELQRNRGKLPQVVITMPLLEGTDGVQKMSKSLGNAIGITEDPSEMYGRVMSISDELMLRYYELLSDAGSEKLSAIRGARVHPMEAKKALAEEIVARHHDALAATRAAEEFRRRFQLGGLPDDVPLFRWSEERGPVAICELLKEAGLVGSMAEARRLVAQGGVRVDGAKITTLTHEIGDRVLLVQVGKRRVVRVVLSR